MDIKKVILDDLSEVKRNILLLLNAKSNEPIQGKLWYQKGLFLLSKHNQNLKDEADFESYFWGPYSELAESETEELINLGIVKKENSRYDLTSLGREIANSVVKKVSTDEKEMIERIKTFLNSLSREELLLFIYVTYPDTVEDAVEFRNLLLKRKEIAVRMYQNGKISVGKAAELADLSIDEMIKELQRRRIYKVEER